MSGELLALGVSHKTAPLELRERLALTEGRATTVLAELTGHEEIHEAVAISTCNRTELYLVTTDPVAAESAALAVLARPRTSIITRPGCPKLCWRVSESISNGCFMSFLL